LEYALFVMDLEIVDEGILPRVGVQVLIVACCTLSSVEFEFLQLNLTSLQLDGTPEVQVSSSLSTIGGTELYKVIGKATRRTICLVLQELRFSNAILW
jgi:hypothetical protein